MTPAGLRTLLGDVAVDQDCAALALDVLHLERAGGSEGQGVVCHVVALRTTAELLLKLAVEYSEPPVDARETEDRSRTLERVARGAMLLARGMRRPA